MLRPNNVRAGFTLVELLAAIGIIALLLAILLPIISKARQHARLARCSSNLHQMDLALRERQSRATRLQMPHAMEWAAVVAGDLRRSDGGHLVLSCPDGTIAGVPQESPLNFIVHRGNGTGDASSSRLNGSDWRISRQELGENHYRVTTQFNPKKADERMIVEHEVILGAWEGRLIEAHWAYHVDCIDLVDGTRTNDLKPGAVIRSSSDRTLDYGYNIMASQLTRPKQGKILVMDYHKSIVDFDGFPLPQNNDDDPDQWLPKNRHLRKINVLLSDGSVQAMLPAELLPMLSEGPNPLYAIGLRQGPNPGGESTSSDGGKGGNDKK